MEQYPKFINETIEINLFVIPIITFWGKRDFIFKLSDSAYGEWLIYENNKLKYYFNVFDKSYDLIKDKIDCTSNLEELLSNRFKQKKLNLMINNAKWGILKRYKPFFKIFKLEKLPVEIFY